MGRVRFILCLLGLLILFSATALARNYVLIVGVEKYKDKRTLEVAGAIKDTKNLENIFKNLIRGSSEIIVLTDEMATKRNILGVLRSFSKKAGAGDKVYFFFSGHGTSIYDENLWRNYFKKEDRMNEFFRYFEASGAIVPYDFKRSSLKEIARTLIVGHRDLRPILKELDKKRVLTIVAFDACFSGTTVRSPTRGNIRGFSLPSNISEVLSEKKKNPPYSYKNIIYIAASTKYETASGSEKTGGVLTKMLTTCIEKEADRNGDRNITKREMEICLEKLRRNPQFNTSLQTPTVHPQKKKENVILFSLKGSSFNPTTPGTESTAKNEEIKLMVKGISPSKFKGFKIVKKFKDCDFAVVKKKKGYSLIFNAGGIEGKVKPSLFSSLKEVKDYLRKYKLFHLHGNPDIPVKVAMFMNGIESRQFKVGSEPTIRMETKGKNRYFFLFSMDKEGNVLVLEPIDGTPAKYQELEFEGVIEKPIGIEFLKGIVLSDPKLAGEIYDVIKKYGTKEETVDAKSIILNPKAVLELVKVLKRNRDKWGEMFYPVVSYE